MVAGPNGIVVPRIPNDSNSEDGLADRWRRAGVDPRLIGGIPALPRVVTPLTVGLPVSRAMDRFLGRLIERWTMERLLNEGYVDCIPSRSIREHAGSPARPGNCPRGSTTSSRAATSQPHVTGADVVGSRTWPDPDAAVASDHYPVVADFSV